MPGACVLVHPPLSIRLYCSWDLPEHSMQFGGLMEPIPVLQGGAGRAAADADQGQGGAHGRQLLMTRVAGQHRSRQLVICWCMCTIACGGMALEFACAVRCFLSEVGMARR